MYSLLNTCLRTLSQSIKTIDKAKEVPLILAIVVLGVLSRDFDFTHIPPDDEEGEGLITIETHDHFIPIVQNLLETALETKLSGPLNREYYCHLLHCYLRVMSRSVNTISPLFIHHFNQVCSHE